MSEDSDNKQGDKATPEKQKPEKQKPEKQKPEKQKPEKKKPIGYITTQYTLKDDHQKLWESLSGIEMPKVDIPLIRLANLRWADESTAEQTRALEESILSLKKTLGDQARTIYVESPSSVEKSKKIEELEKLNDELQTKQRLDYLLSRVNAKAQKCLLNSEEFRQRFFDKKECNSFVMSVDIRRSTELMLKSRSPERFSEFITHLCSEFIRIVTENYGVFDKFTGDGILAFFPEFYSGEDAGLYAVNAALQCHSAFQGHYKASRGSFSSVLADVGLGIGIDYGKAHLVHMAGGLTVVGVPVVYACRLGGAPAGHTYLNQPAYEVVSKKSGNQLSYNEATLEIKHEGSILAYDVRENSWALSAKHPDWLGMDTPETPKKQN